MNIACCKRTCNEIQSRVVSRATIFAKDGDGEGKATSGIGHPLVGEEPPQSLRNFLKAAVSAAKSGCYWEMRQIRRPTEARGLRSVCVRPSKRRTTATGCGTTQKARVIYPFWMWLSKSFYTSVIDTET